MSKYNHKKIEKRWQKQWVEDDVFKTLDTSKKSTHYILDMFPYPSGAGLHVGHPKGYIATDIYSRFKRMNGYNVLHPIGWDAFGLPAENFAIKNKVHPKKAVEKNIKRYKEQLGMIGMDYDWSREINTTDPEYYKWTQWIFLQMFKKGLAYQSYEPINWCPSCKTGLANEDVEDGKCERCGSEVEQKPMRQWVLKITDYADRLLSDLTDLDWPESVKESQRNWIGRSEGVEFEFTVAQKNHYVLLHGFTGSPERNFFPWMKSELEKRGHSVEMPELPNTDNPNIEEQVAHVFNTCHFDDNTIVIGHSLGGVVAQIVTERLKTPIKRLVLVGSFTKPDFRDKERPFADTYHWQFDFEKISQNARRIIILRDENDPAVPAIEADILAEATAGELWSIVAREPHFCGTHEPEVLKASLENIRVFTTRPETIYGATYMVLAPEHPLLKELRPNIKNWKSVEKYITETGKKTDLERASEDKEKTGIQLEGVSAVNPANGEEIPVYIADYVMTSYGTGAIMAVPAHDERDWEFARMFGLPIRQVVRPVYTDERNPPRDGFKTVPRNGIIAIVKHPSENKVLTLDWKHQDWRTFVIGGREEGEDAFTAAKREIQEETGYTDLYFEGQLGQEMHAHFHAPHKGVNREAFTNVLVFRLNSMEKEEVSEEELEKHTPEWSDWDVIPELVHSERFLIERWLKTGNYAYTGVGELVNSGEFDGLDSDTARNRITEAIGGTMRVNYKLNDWVFSRQRYWGEPIPIIHCRKCGPQPVPEKDLPVELPNVEIYEPTGDGKSPLAGIDEWIKTKCPNCKGEGRREANTMPQWAGSCWYYIAYLVRANSKSETRNPKQFLNLKSQKAQKRIHHWLPVDIYVGGMEHATRHLIYARFWHKFLYDLNIVSTTEPFSFLKTPGLIVGADGQKMSKRFGNVVNPDEVIERYGADAFRIYEMFLGPFEQSSGWNTDSIIGISRFLDKIWRIQDKVSKQPTVNREQQIETLIHKTVKKVTEDIKTFDFNTAISAMMILANELDKQDDVDGGHYKTLISILAPFAPHITEELWRNVIGNKRSVHLSEWPEFDPKKVKDNKISVAVQVDGKVRSEIVVQPGLNDQKVKEIALLDEKVKHWTSNKAVIKRIIVVPDKIVNIVTE